MDYYYALLTENTGPEITKHEGCSLEEAFQQKLADRDSIIPPLETTLNPINVNTITNLYKDTMEKMQLCNKKKEDAEKVLEKYNALYESIKENHKKLIDFVNETPCCVSATEQNELNEKMYDLNKFILNATMPWRKDQESQLTDLSIQRSELIQTLCSFREFFSIALTASSDTIVKSDKKCPICWEGEPIMCAVPCGHTYCGECIKSIVTKRCGICNKYISSYVRIFYS